MSNDRTRHKEVLNRYGLKWDPLSIHSKDFAVRMRGYDREEVDNFLDEIIADYERMIAVIEQLEKQAEQTMVLTREREPARPNRAAEEPPAPHDAGRERYVTKDELAMIKVRLANLERKVFGSSRVE
jgi:DivIVA domain-containing protein